MKNYNKLDVAAKLFPSVASKNNSSVFRASIILNETIDPQTLQLAVNMIYERFSLFFMRLKKGVFWNYFDKNYLHFTIEKEKYSPCKDILTIENNGFVIKVLYFNNRISVEAFHSITDGSGIIEFLKSLVFYYLSIKYGEFDSQGKILLFDETNVNDEDSFKVHFSRLSKNKSKKDLISKKSFKLTGKKFKKGGHSVVTGTTSVIAVKNYCKKNNCTVTSLLVANMISAIYEVKQLEIKNNKPIIVAVPVNLRKRFPSKTLKNFFGVVNVGYQMTKETTFKELLNSINEQLLMFTEDSYLENVTEKNVKLSNNVLSKFTPLFLKNVLMPVGFNIMGEKKKTITISNIGKIDLPDDIKPFIVHTEILLYSTAKSPINCGVCSYNDILSISFTRNIIDSSIIRNFFILLSKNIKSDITVYSNDWGEKNEKM